MEVQHVEVRQRARSGLSRGQLEAAATQWARGRAPGCWTGAQLPDELSEHVEQLRLEGNGGARVHVYRVYEQGGVPAALGEAEDEQAPAAARWALPSRDFEGLWDSLQLEPGVTTRLLRSASAALKLASRGLQSHLVNVNRVILLHGPPGTGKTTLCKALAQKLAIRLHRPAHFIEIDSHSLFSKWFSESGKLVTKLFDGIVDIAEDPSSFVFILIDEIESLVHTRSASGSEPSDSIRAVNAVLTQLDRMRRYPNVLVLATSNMTEAIDPAFADRADVKQYIGLPSVPAIYKIYRSCMDELIRVEVVSPVEVLFDYEILKMGQFERNESTESSLALLDLGKLSEGFSGRTLRKIPFMTYAALDEVGSVNYVTFISAMKTAIIEHLSDSEAFSSRINNIKIKGGN